MKVQVLDVVMGYGKSTSAIATINSEPDNFYFVVLPYLDEVSRYKNECNTVLNDNNQLIEPSGLETSKSKDLLNILQKRLGSVVTTHAMFENLKAEHMSSITNLPLRKGEKVLILDETIDLVKPVSSSRLPKAALQADVENEYIIVNETTGLVKWNCFKDEMNGKYPHHEYLKDLCDTGMLFFIDDQYLVMEVPLDFLNCFDRVIVMTYRWSSSIMANYLKVNNIGWEMLPVNQSRVLEVYKYISEHLIIPDHYSVGGLSKNQMKTQDVADLKKDFNKSIKSAMEEYSVSIEDMLFTTFRKVGDEDLVDWYKTIKVGKWQRKDSMNRVEPVTFLSHTTLGTNEYANCRLMVYGLDKHLMPGVHSYFAKRDHSISGDAWALSSLLQWLFRGCIRDHDSGKDMVAVILSPRMRKMAQEWLAGIKRQVQEGKVQESAKVLNLDSKERRTKMQQFKQWKAKNPGGECFSFEDYINHGGVALKKKLKQMKQAA